MTIDSNPDKHRLLDKAKTAINSMSMMRITLNQDETALSEGAEVSIIPAIAGG